MSGAGAPFRWRLLAFCYPPPIFGQNVSVKSVALLEFDTTAGLSDIRDNNGEKAALLKVQTTERGFTFDVGKIGILKTEPQTRGGSHDAEIWVWVPANSRKLTIQHPQLGLLRDFDLVAANGAPLEPGHTYEVVLESGAVNSLTVSDYSKTQVLNLTVTPADATVFINNVPQTLKDGKLSLSLPLGDVLLVVSKPLYETHKETLRLGTEMPENVNLTLKQNFGYLVFAPNPEYDGAEVYIDGIKAGTLPLQELKLDAGMHDLDIVKPLYTTHSERVNVLRNQTKRVEPKLDANFANISIQAPADCEIWLNGDFKGVGSWEGKLDPDTYVAEAVKKNYRPSRLEFNVERNKKEVFTLPAPEPIYGALEVTVVPGGADVFIDGELRGQSGEPIENILIGEHKVRIVNNGYRPIETTVNIVEGDVTPIGFQLDSTCDVMLRSTPTASEVYLNGRLMGETPYHLETESGTYNLAVKKEGYFSFNRSMPLNGSTEDLTIKLRKKIIEGTYLSVGYDPVGKYGFTVAAGTYIANVNISAFVSPLQSQTATVYWNSSNVSVAPYQCEYKPFSAGFKAGYGLKLLKNKLRITPQAGVSWTRLTERNLRHVDGFTSDQAVGSVANGSNVLSVSGGVKAQYRIWKFIGVSVTPEYKVAVKKSAGYAHLESMLPDIFKPYGQGFSLNASVDFIF